MATEGAPRFALRQVQNFKSKTGKESGTLISDVKKIHPKAKVNEKESRTLISDVKKVHPKANVNKEESRVFVSEVKEPFPKAKAIAQSRSTCDAECQTIDETGLEQCHSDVHSKNWSSNSHMGIAEKVSKRDVECQTIVEIGFEEEYSDAYWNALNGKNWIEIEKMKRDGLAEELEQLEREIREEAEDVKELTQFIHDRETDVSQNGREESEDIVAGLQESADDELRSAINEQFFIVDWSTHTAVAFPDICDQMTEEFFDAFDSDQEVAEEMLQCENNKYLLELLEEKIRRVERENQTLRERLTKVGNKKDGFVKDVGSSKPHTEEETRDVPRNVRTEREASPLCTEIYLLPDDDETKAAFLAQVAEKNVDIANSLRAENAELEKKVDEAEERLKIAEDAKRALMEATEKAENLEVGESEPAISNERETE